MDCYTCARTGDPADLPPRELIGGDDHWRVAHAFGTALPGWLVLIPRRHVTSIAELTDEEAAGLGRWQVRVSRALGEVTGCAKTYVAQFAEAEGFAHVHFHIVPRSSDHPEELRGPRVFGLLDKGAGTPVMPEEMDRLALLLRAALADR
ncbi:HIT family protein [Kitasatospora sp. NPDC085879]|uniref:HIT family protein n=1 Tax=Kitasatospora sp. NPDC085879 TaxID=3154769 RepID=UPI003446EED9